ncbi:hypothetical protein NQ318_021885, partial [Aromia moschata]
MCKLSIETGNVAPDLATLRRQDLAGRHSQKKEGRLNTNYAAEGLHLQALMKMSIEYGILYVQISAVDHKNDRRKVKGQ